MSATTRESLRRLLCPPPFGDQDLDARARPLYSILLASLAVSTSAFVGLLMIGNHLSAYGALSAAGMVAVMIMLLRRGRVAAASMLLLVTMLMVTAYLQWIGNGLLDVAILLYPTMILVASLLVSPRNFILITTLAFLSLGLVIFGHLTGRLDMHGLGRSELALDGLFAMLFLSLTALAGHLLSRNIRQNIARARESERKYRLLVEYAGDAVFVTQDGVVTLANPQTERISGRTAGEIVGQPWFSLLHVEDRALIVERSLPTGAFAHDTVTFRVVRPDGAVRWVQARAEAVPWEGRPATLVFGRDVTDQRRLEEQLRQSQKMEAIGTLAGGIAHDFNNILSIIFGYAEVALLKLPRESPLVENIGQIVKAADRATHLVSQILTFSRQSETRAVPCDIRPIIKETLKFLRCSLPSTVEMREQVGPVGTVVVDPTQLHQVVMNLGTNAWHAMQERGGVLEVALSGVRVDAEDSLQQALPPGRYAKLTVSDTGAGIPAEVLGRIFEPYFTTKEPGKGTGLGLSVVHGIAKQAGGDVKVYSEPGLGTTFHVYLPVASSSAAAEEARAEVAPRGSERVLLVDDEPLIVAMATESLEALGYRVTGTTSSEEALALFLEDPSRFDVVVTDLTMPKLNGEGLARQVLEGRPDVPVLICTGFSEALTTERIQTLGVHGVLMKPVPRALLARAIREALVGAQDSGADDRAAGGGLCVSVATGGLP